jgi:hypothetical protein
MSKSLYIYFFISVMAGTVLFSACSPQLFTTPEPVTSYQYHNPSSSY